MHEIVVLIDKIHWFSLDRIEELVFFLNGTSKNLPYRGVILILYTTPTECLRHCAENAMDVASFWFSEKKIVTWSLRHITNADEKEVECTISLSLILSYITRFSVSRLTKITFFFFTRIWKHAFVLSECACMNMYNLAVDRCLQTTRLLNHLHSQWLADSHIIYFIARAIFSDSWTHAPLHRVNKTIAGLLYTEKRVGF